MQRNSELNGGEPSSKARAGGGGDVSVVSAAPPARAPRARGRLLPRVRSEIGIADATPRARLGLRHQRIFQIKPNIPNTQIASSRT